MKTEMNPRIKAALVSLYAGQRVVMSVDDFELLKKFDYPHVLQASGVKDNPTLYNVWIDWSGSKAPKSEARKVEEFMAEQSPLTDFEIFKRRCNSEIVTALDSMSLEYDKRIENMTKTVIDLKTKLMITQHALRYIADHEDLFFAECSDAEQIIEVVRKALETTK